MKSKYTAILLAIGMLLLSGCQTISDNPLIAYGAVTFATGKVLENNPTYAPKVQAIAAQVRAATDGEVFDTVEAAMVFTESLIPWEKITSAADRDLIRVLLAEVKIQLMKRLGSGTLTPANLLVVSEVASWIEQAAVRAQAVAP